MGGWKFEDRGGAMVAVRRGVEIIIRYKHSDDFWHELEEIAASCAREYPMEADHIVVAAIRAAKRLSQGLGGER